MTSAAAALAVALTLMLVVPPAGGQGRVGELTAQLSSPDPALRARAACELREFGEGAAPALGPLVALLSDAAPLAQPVCGRDWWRGHPNALTSPGDQAAAALAAIGSRAFTPLLAALENPAWIARRHAAWALGVLDNRQAVEPLLRRLTDPEAQVREQACWALGVIGDERALHPLLPYLKDPDARVRRQAAWAIGILNH